MVSCTSYFSPVPAPPPREYLIRGVPQPRGVAEHPDHLPGAPKDFPQAYAAPSEALDPAVSGREARKLIDEQLPAAGALLLQGLPMTTHEQCKAFVRHLGYTVASYEPVGQKRDKVAGTLEAATTIPADVCLTLHNEESYNPRPPSKVLLMCLQPAEQGGENLLARNADMLPNLPPSLLDTFEQKGGIRHMKQYPSASKVAPGSIALTWQQRTGTTQPEAALQSWRKVGFTEVSFTEDETLVVANTMPAFRAAPDGSRPFLNSASLPLALPPGVDAEGFWTMKYAVETVQTMITYGNGDPIDMDTCNTIEKAKWAAACVVPLQAGSVLVLENWAVMHGRLSYKGSRSMVVLLTND